MRNLFLPDIMFRSIFDIDADFFLSKGIDTVILDIDNTLVTYGDAEPTDEVCFWVDRLRAAGLNVAVASNNKKERVEAFCKHFGTVPEKCAVVGDQIFTDVLCATRAGAYAVLVTPLKYKENLFFKFKRALEKSFIRMYKNKEKRRKDKEK